jgi:hypothetical protein
MTAVAFSSSVQVGLVAGDVGASACAPWPAFC